jgi:hypothetical protein
MLAAIVDLIWVAVTGLACLSAGWWFAGADRRVRLSAIRDARRHRDRLAVAHWNATHPSLN